MKTFVERHVNIECIQHCHWFHNQYWMLDTQHIDRPLMSHELAFMTINEPLLTINEPAVDHIKSHY